MAVEEYKRKRDFAKSPEPAPEARAAAASTFVVHRHEARRLHYDFRITTKTALACWAVPKGFSYDPADKRLAVRTEDHPLAYEEFEGVIPQGLYGAGTMQIWDAGTYGLKKELDIAKALEKGEVKLVLNGRKLRGEWHLVRTKGAEGKEWLLFKTRDRYVGSGSSLFGGADMTRAIKKPLPRRFARMEPAAGFQPFTDPDWLFETAFVGKRVLASIHSQEVSLRAREGELAPRLPGIASGVRNVRAESAVFDGIVVALDRRGRPSEEALAEQLESGGAMAVLYIFDVLYAEEWDLRQMPLRERKAVVRALLPDLRQVLVVDPVAERGEALAQAAAESGFEAIIAKRSGSPYRAGPAEDWRLISVGSPVARRKVVRRVEAASPIITHPRKVYWPEQGYTKGDLMNYYDRASAWILPYLKDRPLHLYRWPDGIRGKSFYQKQLPEGLPDWVQTVNIARPGEAPSHYIVCNDRRTLLLLINTGTIDLHPWLSRKGSLDSPDWTILDLDPKEAPFSNVIKVARIIGKLLRGLGLEPYLKTSGSTGLHICVPLTPGYTYEQSRMFCEAVARLVVRPVEAASVSMPLLWDELEEDFRIEDFTIVTAPGRIEKVGDIFRTALSQPHDLAPAIEAMEKYLHA
jgi:bifunctional non-homologous end joining protein LigD